jgi:hypothetical protein
MSDPKSNASGGLSDTSSAPEEGDVKESGRNRGQVVEPGGSRDAKDRSGGTGEQPESGRQDAAPRTGK